MTVISDTCKEPPLKLDKETAAKMLLSVYGFSANAEARHKQFLIAEAYRDKRLAHYCNMSAQLKGQNGEIEMVRQYCAKEAEKIEGWAYAGAYIDTAYRYQRRFLERTAFEQMLTDAKGGKIDLIVTDKIERFTDSIYKTLELTEELRLLPRPVTVMFEETGIDSETIHDLLMMVS